MKYKNINSAIHNFGDSFMGGLNYFDNDHVMYDIHKMVGKSAENKISINFSEGTISHPKLATKRVIASVACYTERLAEHFESQNIQSELVRNVTLVVKQSLMGNIILVTAVDDRGQQYSVQVKA